MATVYLRRSEEEFYDESPRRLISMIDEWFRIEHERERMRAYFGATAFAGNEIPELPQKIKPKPKYVNSFFF